jgi:hypothetical protein
MDSDITSAKIYFHLTKKDFEVSLNRSFSLIFLGATIIGLLLYCGEFIVSEWSSNTYGLYILLLLISPVIWLGVNAMCEGIFPFFGEFIITVDAEQLSVIRKISIIAYSQSIKKEDITEVGQLYCRTYPEDEEMAVLFRRSCIQTNGKQTFFGDCIKQENKDMIITEINKFIFEQE